MRRFIFRKEKNGWIVYDKNSEEIFFINDSAKLILEKLEEGYSPKKISSFLSEKYNIPKKSVKKDIKNFLDKFKEYTNG